MSKRVCPWWLGYLLVSPLRRLRNNPLKLLSPYVRTGMTVFEPGPGMGFFTLDLARLVGESGRVISVDVQRKMLDTLERRARKAGFAERIDARLVAPDSMGIDDLAGKVDFTLAFAMVHEFPSADKFFAEVARASKPGATLFVAEPKGHVRNKQFDGEIEAAEKAGFVVERRSTIPGNHVAVLKRHSG